MQFVLVIEPGLGFKFPSTLAPEAKLLPPHYYNKVCYFHGVSYLTFTAILLDDLCQREKDKKEII